MRHGPAPLRDDELLAAVLGTGARGRGAAGAASALVARFPDLRRMAAAGVGELAQVPGVGVAQACRLKAALALAARLGERPYARGEQVLGPEDIYDRIGRRLLTLDREVFVAIALDVKNRILGEHRIAEGGVCSVDVLPRDVFGVLVRDTAVATVLIHNHPSGDPSPSTSDKVLTERFTAAGVLVGVRVLDHIIVAQGGYYAFSGQGTVVR